MTELDANSTAEEADAPSQAGNSRFNEPWFRFALIFGVLAIASEISYYALALDSPVFDVYLRALAWISGNVLQLFSDTVVVHESRISGNGFAVEVAAGCDAVQVCSLLAAAVIAFPMELKGKIRGLVVGILILQILNFMRITTLYWIGAFYPSIFKAAHETIWPGFLIFATIVIWIVWVRLETRAGTSADHAA